MMTAMPTPGVAPPGEQKHRARVGFWRGPWAARTWREFTYSMWVLAISPVAFTYAVLTVSFIPSVAITVVGLFLGGWLVLGARGWGRLFRSLAHTSLAIDVATPPPPRRAFGFWRKLWANLSDTAGWRALAFVVIAFIVGLIGGLTNLTLLITSLSCVTHTIWIRWIPAAQYPDGTVHPGIELGPGFLIDTPARHVLLIAIGFLLLFIWAQLTLAFGQVMRLLTSALLGPTAGQMRVAELTRTRSAAVVAADERLRHIERDLHDGTQARLVTLAMQLGEAKAQLAANGDPKVALDLVTVAHASAKETMTELREIARGIRPPALENGLAVALASLTARVQLPVTLDVSDDLRLPPEVEAIAYFCVSELLTNVVKHANATGAYVLIDSTADDIVIRVRDDGSGGAHVVTPDEIASTSTTATGGTGLRGLAERVATVDGTFSIESPVGEHTVVTVRLPRRSS